MCTTKCFVTVSSLQMLDKCAGGCGGQGGGGGGRGERTGKYAFYINFVRCYSILDEQMCSNCFS